MKLTPLKAIRAKCVDCSGGNRKEATNCPSEKCPLWQYRTGKNPNRQGIGGNPGCKDLKYQLELKKKRGNGRP